jgi:hypothetical protein
MKKVIIIGSYPKDKLTEQMLIDCINSLKNFGWDIILTSHIAISKEIVEMVDFYIYDKENKLEPIELTPIYWYNTSNFQLYLNGRGHIIPVCRNIRNGIGLSEVLGYDLFYYMESDNILEISDIQKLKDISNSMLQQEKSLIFFKPGDELDPRYESLMFGGKPSYFLKNMTIPLKIEDMLKHKMDLTLEEIFFNSIKWIVDDCYIINSNSTNFLKNSTINLIANHARCEVIRDTKNNGFGLWISNSAENPENISFSINDNDFVYLPANGFYYLPVNIGQNFKITLIENNRKYFKEFDINLNNLHKFNESGEINFI